LVDLIKGKYRIVREIARSNDIVYEAVDSTLGRRIALKELNIPPSLTGQARRERIERFVREARAAGRLSHPNIVAVFDFGEENGRHFIAMEYLEGQTLRDRMQVQGALPLKDALTIAYQVLDALAYAHANRVIHRDIKPDNIHILPGGQIKLTDFGIARLTEEPALTGDGQVFGTPSYMSPEQIIGRDIDYRSDLFSLAVVLYEMLTGRKPFGGDSVVSITYAIMHAPPAPMMGVPPAIEQVILRALAKDPRERHVSAEQMKRELQQAEQMPALPPGMQTMSRTGMGYGYHSTGAQLPVPPPSWVPGGYSGGRSGQSANYGNVPPGGYIAAPAPSAMPAAAPVGDPLPWNWNNAGAPGSANAAPSLPQPAPSAPVAGAGGTYPFGTPAYPSRPAAPAFTLSPGARAFLVTILLSAVLGGGISAGVIAFLHSYDQYRRTVSAQSVVALVNQGVTAYNAQDYATAADLFSKALAVNTNSAERGKIIYNLAAAYVQLAHAAESRGDLQAARDNYRKALDVDPDNATAHNGLANILDRLGDTAGAGAERAAAQSGGGSVETPSALKTISPSEEAASGTDARQFVEERRAEARRLIQEGDELAQQGDKDGAREKWQQAISMAPGTPERDAAKARMDQTQTPPNFDVQ